MDIDLSVDADRLAKRFGFAARQAEFASVRAATQLARLVQAEETAALPEVLDHPTPFTMRAFAVRGATMARPQAEVFAKTIQARYLDPSEVGAQQLLGTGKSVRTPVDIRTNQYGNLPKGAILRRTGGALSVPGKRGFFIGVIGGINGLWQRVPGKKGQPASVKLLVAFTRPVEIHAHLEFQKRARRVVLDNYASVFTDELRKALETAR